jgi:small ligand-binding sensory domain FIST
MLGLIAPCIFGLVAPWISRVAIGARWQDSLGELRTACADVPASSPSLGFLFVDSTYCLDDPDAFGAIVRAADEQLGVQTLVSVLSNGVIGGGCELQGEPALTFLAGPLPRGSSACALAFGDDELLGGESAQRAALEAAAAGESPPHSFVLLCDPYSQITPLLRDLDAVFDTPPICGGLSSGGGPSETLVKRPSLALGGRVLPVGSAAVVGLAGSLALHTILAQSCMPVGPTFTVTSVEGQIVRALDDTPALEILSQVAHGASDAERKLMESPLLCGVRSAGTLAPVGDDFRIRGIVGATADGGLCIATDRAMSVGDGFRFHVQDRRSAQADLDRKLQRYRLEMQFARPVDVRTDAAPLAALLVSCVSRGSRLFGVAGHDSQCAQAALGYRGSEVGEPMPLSGFFSNGELGSVGVRMGGASSADARPGADLHAYVSAFGLLYATEPPDSVSLSDSE